MQKPLLMMSLLMFSIISYADKCPSVADIKNGQLHGWQAYDSDDGKPLSAHRYANFKKHAEKFTLAEWVKHSPKGTVHCYYGSNTGSDLGAYLAKQDLSPVNSVDYWYQVSGALDCAAGMDQCEFQKGIIDQPQLADNEG